MLVGYEIGVDDDFYVNCFGKGDDFVWVLFQCVDGEMVGWYCQIVGVELCFQCFVGCFVGIFIDVVEFFGIGIVIGGQKFEYIFKWWIVV